jgi:hypothetical protein
MMAIRVRIVAIVQSEIAPSWESLMVAGRSRRGGGMDMIAGR